jgi:hypothetical protein
MFDSDRPCAIAGCPKDGDRSTNDPSNLELWVGPMRYGVRASDLVCPHCHKRYYDPMP